MGERITKAYVDFTDVAAATAAMDLLQVRGGGRGLLAWIGGEERGSRENEFALVHPSVPDLFTSSPLLPHFKQTGTRP